MTNIILLPLEKLAYGGEAIGRYAGKAIFVPFGLPGETVRVRLVEERKNFARAELLEVLSASPARIAPRCPHFGVCGGCAYQHLAYPDQLAAKSEILRDQLTRIGKISDPPLQPIVAAPRAWNYRNHIQFHLDEEARLGFIAASALSPRDLSPLKIVPVTECHLPQDEINALWPNLHFEPGAPLQRVALRAGDEMLLVLESDSPETPELELEAEISVVHLLEDHAVTLAGDDYLPINVLGRLFKVSAASFFQVNTAMAEKMVTHVLGLLPAAPALILDVYCGVGLFSAFLAPRAEKLIGIEVSPSACEDFAVNLDEFDNVALYEAAAEQVLPALNLHPDVILVDPPRAGLEKPALDAILASGAPTLIYVSCDPSTLARDAARLMAGGYTLQQVTPFDLFPQTYHIESISLFVKK
ncbi:MAG: 23S rRNA (uracil(1939)-C(5))-methyltransferase RlmD [Anaerolineales bacterium]